MVRVIFFSLIFLCAGSSFSEAFGNSSVSIPKLGLVFYDDVFGGLEKPWGIASQWSVGTSFMTAIDYRWWWVVESQFAMGKLSEQGSAYLSSFMGGGGVRCNIFQNEFRPHTGLILHYLQFFGESAKSLPLKLDWPIFVGLKPYFGMEWLFYSEMAFNIDLAYALYVNIHEPFRHVLYTNLSFAFYF